VPPRSTDSPGATLDRRLDKDGPAGAEDDASGRKTETSECYNGCSKETMQRLQFEPSIEVANVGSVEHLERDQNDDRDRYD